MTNCPTCGIRFTPTPGNSVYCTPACRPQVREERAAARPAPPSKPKRRARSERFATLNTFLDFGISAAKLKPAEALVWFMLYRDVKADGTARTGQCDIARRAGLDVRTVRRAIAALQAKGFVAVVRRGRLNAGPSVYRVHPTGAA
jgi:CRP-like cAMP-binding protein